MTTCKGCGTEFEPARYHKAQKYHSHKCALSHINRDSERQKLKGKAAGAVRGLQLKASAAGDGYVKAPGVDLHEHRRVASEVLGRPLLPGEVVHHEDLNKANNHPTNLIVFPTQAVHARHHGKQHPGSPCDCPGIRLKDLI